MLTLVLILIFFNLFHNEMNPQKERTGYAAPSALVFPDHPFTTSIIFLDFECVFP